MKKKYKIFLYCLVAIAGIGLTVCSLIIEVNYFDSDIVWQCLLGALWTIASIFVFIFGIVSAYNTFYEKEKLKIKKNYLSVDGKSKTFQFKDRLIKIDGIKRFLTNANEVEKIFILNKNGKFSILEVYIDFISVSSRKYDYDTKEILIDNTVYKNVDEAIEFLSNKDYIYDNDKFCVIGYEHSSPYYLQKRIDSIQ